MTQRDYSLYASLYDEQHDKPISKRAAFIVGILFAIVLALVGIAGTMTYHDVIEANDTYCEMVDIGAWPDFKQSFKRDCGGKEAPKFISKKTT